ncbi:MAG: outer membrane protein assembly factor [Rhodospirillales bacterium]|nr:outer membrane protein assembly factor [Rhodospirillales bacterium]
MRLFCSCCILFAAFLGLVRPAAAEIAYKTEITGVDRAIRNALSASARLVSLADRPPPSIAALRRRAEGDLPQLLQILHDEGYWSATIDLKIDDSADPVRVTLAVNLGPLYTLASIEIHGTDSAAPPLAELLTPAALGLAVGGPAKAADVVAAEAKIVAIYRDNGRPFAKVVDRRVVVDDGTHTVSVSYTVDAGPAVTFGTMAIEGLEDLARGWVENRIAWRKGAPYDERKVETTRKALLDSNLFSIVDLSHAAAPAADGSVPMTVRLAERLPHSIGTGIEYSTSLGFGARAFWEDRNIFGNAESLRITGQFAQAELAALLRFRKPDFIVPDQDFLITGELADDSPPAYTSRHLRLQPGIERHFDEHLVTAGAALAYEKGNLTAFSGPSHYKLVGAPLYLRYDDTGSLLDPTHGLRAGVETTPYHGIDAESPSFLSTKLSGSTYFPLLPGERLVSANFVRIGSILGTSRDKLPADKRFYVGGGGSVRGYGYQRVGALEGGDKPLGGSASLEIGTELRVKVTESIGVVPFVEAGNVYSTPFPKLAGRLFVGAGIGLRYYTAIGPVRFDVATPVTPVRPGDGVIQVYVSLGQAF